MTANLRQCKTEIQGFYFPFCSHLLHKYYTKLINVKMGGVICKEMFISGVPDIRSSEVQWFQMFRQKLNLRQLSKTLIFSNY